VPKEELAEVLLTLSLQFHTHGCFQMCPGREMTHAKKMMTIGGILNTLCLLMQDGRGPHGLGHHRSKWIATRLLNHPYNMYSVSIAAAPIRAYGKQKTKLVFLIKLHGGSKHDPNSDTYKIKNRQTIT